MQSARYQKLPSCRSIQISGVRKRFYFFGPRFGFSPGPEKSISGFKSCPTVGCRLIVKNIFRKKSRDRHFEIIYQGPAYQIWGWKSKVGRRAGFFKSDRKRHFWTKKQVFRPIMAAKWKILKTDKPFSVSRRFRNPVQNFSFLTVTSSEICTTFTFATFFRRAENLFYPLAAKLKKNFRLSTPYVAAAHQLPGRAKFQVPTTSADTKVTPWNTQKMQILFVLV